jgi:hypothetical protein
MKRLSWKYIAGLVDGEGCIDFQCHVDHKTDKPRLYLVPRLRIAMAAVGKDLLELIKIQLGGSLWLKNRSKNPNWQDAYYWQVSGKLMRPVLQNIVNHLVLKQEQARLCIWWIDRCMGRQLSKLNEVESIRQCARDELKAMKLDPQRLSGEAVKKLTQLINGCDSPTEC